MGEIIVFLSSQSGEPLQATPYLKVFGGDSKKMSPRSHVSSGLAIDAAVISPGLRRWSSSVRFLQKLVCRPGSSVLSRAVGKKVLRSKSKSFRPLHWLVVLC